MTDGLVPAILTLATAVERHQSSNSERKAREKTEDRFEYFS